MGDVMAGLGRQLEEAMREMLDSDQIQAAPDPDSPDLIRIYIPETEARTLVELVRRSEY